MYEKPPALFLYLFVLCNDIMLSAVTPIGSFVRSVSSVAFPARSSIRDQTVNGYAGLDAWL